MPAAQVKLSEILLQDQIVKRLSTFLAHQKLSQAYLFSGQRSIGKARVAKAFAAALQCLEPLVVLPVGEDDQKSFEACGKCLSCRRIASDNHPDVFFVTPQGNDIRVDQIRSIQGDAALTPYMGKWRIIIIDPADRLNEHSANALLKILEEAPPRVIFILLAESAEVLLPTILSRSMLLPFRIPSHQESREALCRLFPTQKFLVERLFSLSEGKFGVSFEWLGTMDLLDPRDVPSAEGQYPKSAGDGTLLAGRGDPVGRLAEAPSTSEGVSLSGEWDISEDVEEEELAEEFPEAEREREREPHSEEKKSAVLPELTLPEAQVCFLEEWGKETERWHTRIKAVTSLEEGLRLLANPKRQENLLLLNARKTLICRLCLSHSTPASFPILLTRLILDQVDLMKKSLKKTVEGLVNSQKANYASPVLREIDDQFQGLVNGIADSHLAGFLESILNWLADVFRLGHTGESSLLLNIDQKDDIMRLARRWGMPILRRHLDETARSLSLFRRYVNPAFILENLLSNLGGTNH